ncbi:MAG TPA: ATP-binding protein [Solirubrobacteraceae bacterium]|nr:ATP-binding protein [Solirubrobacteraceae bacterium]
MDQAALSSLFLRSERPSKASGVLAAAASVGAATAVIYPLKQVTPVLSLVVLYMLAVVVVSTFWGLAFGVATSVLSAAAFNFFHLPPLGRFALADDRDWAALVALVVVAVATGLVADAARSRGFEAERRRKEADLAAELAQLLLGSADVKDALDPAGERLASALGSSSARIELRADSSLEDDATDAGSVRFELRDAQREIGALVVQGALTSAEREHARERLLPPLESILAAALHRAELEAEVVETAALRRSDELKTAVLRSVSHDLRTPLAAILMAAAALNAERPTSENVSEVREQVLAAATRLGHVIEKLLDLSLLESGRAEPRRVWYSIDEVLHEAIAQIDAPDVEFALSIDEELPLLQGDPAQLERAFANVLENAARYCDRRPVSVRARAVRDRVRILIVDQGPGIAPAEQERIFLPFYRAAEGGPHASGSGLGLAITRGFLDLNGGRIRVESVPGQGTTFVVEFAATGQFEAAVAAMPWRPAAA